ncbi:MAG TPA: tRNA pseudouridine(55) synthase TruB [Spirochaetota bacterium]|mgnify:FL=1|jgi:tRNA pseudouridine55 synthase|nr:MAG: tRNA pseudouridine synthase B [Spirochaetes bacterium ADurb.Bin133]HNZ27265.1 tRNA pseudouridine(55) synthase TruB [Spirochaetota bacterium]HOF01716.1 tRNA pseudouridine(55) synthase TruB [Spirochaetota bacterium]HOS33405.1 tRNA pseudouridine(55) synthase TruB [Spirochaetota bacterium]HOS56449.1 tRNA pseudouridine(55) synthase TruB [Spirochaetota bacterium]
MRQTIPIDNEGLILINKPEGKTSFQAVIELRKKIGIKKIGHSGTLDKAARGLLVFCIGKTTKLLNYLIGLPKKYYCEVTFGIQTNTDDKNGEIINRYDGSIEFDTIKNLLPEFSGIIRQTPPNYSAIHVNGKRAYQLALRDKEMDLKTREVEIKSLNVVGFDGKVLKIEIECSSGTYIRSLARDLGLRSGYLAYVSHLRRDNVGDFSLEEANNLTDDKIKIYSPIEALRHYETINIKEEYVEYFKNGKRLNSGMFLDIDNKNGEFKTAFDNKLLGVIRKENSKISYKFVY